MIEFAPNNPGFSGRVLPRGDLSRLLSYFRVIPKDERLVLKMELST